VLDSRALQFPCESINRLLRFGFGTSGHLIFSFFVLPLCMLAELQLKCISQFTSRVDFDRPRASFKVNESFDRFRPVLSCIPWQGRGGVFDLGIVRVSGVRRPVRHDRRRFGAGYHSSRRYGDLLTRDQFDSTRGSGFGFGDGSRTRFRGFPEGVAWGLG
jgi:hypothetical protein